MMRNETMKGITLLELLVVVAISGILTGFAGYTVHGFRSRFDVESQVRQLHADMMHARTGAVQSNKSYFVTVTTDGYQITEDTNESGGEMPDPGDRALWSEPKQFKFPSQWTGTIIMDAKGIISKSTGPLTADAALAIRFDTSISEPGYDCIFIGATRIREGRWDGTICME